MHMLSQFDVFPIQIIPPASLGQFTLFRWIILCGMKYPGIEKAIVNKVGMAVQKSKQTRVVGITAYTSRHPSYICYQSVNDFMKDVGMSTCIRCNPYYSCLFALLYCHPYFIHNLFNCFLYFFVLFLYNCKSSSEGFLV